MRAAFVVVIALLLAVVVTTALVVRRLRNTIRGHAIAKAAFEKRAEVLRRTAETHYTREKIEAALEECRSEQGGAEPRFEARLAELRDVLERLEASTPSTFPVSGPCAEVIDSFRGIAGERDLLYSESGDGRWLQVEGDRELLRWAVREIFQNVVDHAGSWTRITVKAEPVTGNILLTVRDDGIGLDRPTTARVYTAFSPRLGSSGPGVGLYVVRSIVEAFGGRAEARSTPGGGLLHSLWLPHPSGGPYGAKNASR